MESDPIKVDKAEKIVLQSSNVEEELKLIRRKYDDLCLHMDQILSETMERSNRIVMESEISNLITSQVFNASNDGIWAVDKNYKVIRVNQRLLELIDMPAEAVVGSKCYDLNKELCRNRDDCPMKRIVDGDPMVVQEKAITFKSGKNIEFMVTSTPLVNLDFSIIGLVETYADITARKNAERNLQLANHELERLATEDGLTNLHNRRRFDEYMDSEWRRQSRLGRPIALIMSDVDYFKKFNDHYGHQAGDTCLKTVADVIKKHVGRSSDLSARYGGEEFAVIMPDTDVEGAWHVAERIRKELANVKIPHGYSAVAPFVTISCGIASMFPNNQNKPQMLIERADQGLYGAKQKGRNCVAEYEEPHVKPATSKTAVPKKKPIQRRQKNA